MSSIGPLGPVTLAKGTVLLGSMETYGPNNAGTYGLGRQITFQIDTGDVGSVYVNYDNFNLVEIAARIADLAGQIGLMYTLSNP
jgi:hypothetical protein